MTTTVVRSIREYAGEVLTDSDRGGVRNNEVRFCTRTEPSQRDPEYGMVFFKAIYLNPDGAVVLYVAVGATRSRADRGVSFPLGDTQDLGALGPSLWVNDPIEVRLKDVEGTLKALIGESGVVLKPGELYAD